MILVDSSVWIDYFNGVETTQSSHLDAVLGTEPICIGDLVLLEVLQGFQDESAFVQARELLLALPVCDMLGTSRALRAAELYRQLRRLGVTVRKSNDMIIGAYCIDQRIPLLFCDRDFAAMVTHFDLIDALAA